MPKKTKKQKLLAEHHRQVKSPFEMTSTQFVKSQNEITISSSPSTNTFQIAYKGESLTRPKNLTGQADFFQVKHDLIKITIFTLGALISQGVLYFFLNRG